MPLTVGANHIRLQPPWEDIETHELTTASRAVSRGEWPEVVFEIGEGAVPLPPRLAAPLARLLDYYRRTDGLIRVAEAPDLRPASIGADLSAISRGIRPQPDGRWLQRVFILDSDNVYALVTALVTAALEATTYERGVLPGFEWSLNEIMDNVLQHSRAQYGFVSVNVDAQHGRLQACIADAGVGIYETLRGSRHAPKTELDAITLAIQEGVTRDSQFGQGNGLWGLTQLVAQNSGHLTIGSGESEIEFGAEGLVPTSNALPLLDPLSRGTVVDFELSTSSTIDVRSALGGHDPVSVVLESVANEVGTIVIAIREHAHGTGTRTAAVKLRNEIRNLLTESSGPIVLDFADVAVISSSFADELIGKLVADLGFVPFTQRIALRGTNRDIAALIHRSTALRLATQLGVERRKS